MENAKAEKKIVRAFRAYAGQKYFSKVADTPRQAAKTFFEANPSARKCDVTAGEIETTGGVEFFVSRFGNRFAGGMPQSWKEITKKTVDNLPDENPNETTFDEIFSDVVSGLREYYPHIEGNADIKTRAATEWNQGTGNNQADYERLRDIVERIAK
jgi:hypothetical protein